MLKLVIDGRVCPIADKRVTLPDYRASKLRSVEGWREGRRLNVGVASTPVTDALFHHAGNILRGELFNDSYHFASLEVDGVVVYDGVVTLESVEHSPGGKVYRIAIRSGGAEWADTAALKRLNETDIRYTTTMTLASVEASWNNSSGVVMLPMLRDSYPEVAQTGQYTAQHTLMPHDYHPFISVPTILHKIASAEGYTIQSKFLGTTLASRLMISGGYPAVRTEQAESTMGFKALRSRTTTATAGEDGRVYAWEPIFAANVGGLVDTVSPTTLDESGNPMCEAYSNGGCMTFNSGRPKFTPKREVSVAFDVHLRYTTDFRIVSSQKLQGFNIIHLSPGCELRLQLHNNYVNQRNQVSGGRTYRLFIFDYDPTKSYSITGGSAITGAVSTVTMEAQVPPMAKLYVKGSNDSVWSIYSGDWALYDAHVTGVGQRDVEITVRTPFMKATPTSPITFNDIFFGGAAEGQSLTLASGCSITPIFSGAPGYGQVVSFADVANVDISQLELLEAIAHMFNLCVYTHRPTKRIFIEPYADFFSGRVVDWTRKQLDNGVLLNEGAVSTFEHTTLGYQPADGVTVREMGDAELGTWSRHNTSYGAKQGEERLLNPLFMPTLSLAGTISSAPSAQILTVGDRDDVYSSDNIEPRVILYFGLVRLPEGEMWLASSTLGGYPLGAFHSAAMGQTLCFEERDGCKGLHTYYDREMEERTTRLGLMCQVRISPIEYRDMFDPDGLKATIRSRFRLRVEGNTSLFRLESIEDYNPETCVARCTFRQLLED